VQLEVPLLEFDHVSRFFAGRREVRALTDISLTVAHGEQICISGPSGSGKTTLLNLAGGLIEPSTGSIKMAGKRLDTLGRRTVASLRAREIGFIFQSSNLIPVLTAAENVDFSLRLAMPELTANERLGYVEEALEATRTLALKKSRPGELSGGEAQRIAIARALVKRPRLLLADEPTSHLDDANCEQIGSLFAELHAHWHTTLLIATHDSRILRQASRLLALNEGCLTGWVNPVARRSYAWS